VRGRGLDGPLGEVHQAEIGTVRREGCAEPVPAAFPQRRPARFAPVPPDAPVERQRFEVARKIRFVGLSERLLLRRIRRFIPANADVVALEVAMANPVDDERPTPVVLTNEGLLLVTTIGATAVVTPVPFDKISEARAEGTVLAIGFVDELGRPRTFHADFRRGGAEIIGKFFYELREARTATGTNDERVPTQTFHVAWDQGHGATFDLFDEDGQKRIRPSYDAALAGNIQASVLCERAMLELAQALADDPELVHVPPKPEWMPEFVWTPPLPRFPKD
jgi:hypothetical protein